MGFFHIQHKWIFLLNFSNANFTAFQRELMNLKTYLGLLSEIFHLVSFLVALLQFWIQFLHICLPIHIMKLLSAPENCWLSSDKVIFLSLLSSRSSHSFSLELVSPASHSFCMTSPLFSLFPVFSFFIFNSSFPQFFHRIFEILTAVSKATISPNVCQHIWQDFKQLHVSVKPSVFSKKHFLTRERKQILYRFLLLLLHVCSPILVWSGTERTVFL